MAVSQALEEVVKSAVSATTPAVKEAMLKEAYSATPNYDIDYSDPRFGKVESDKQQAMTELEATYGGMVNSTDKFYDDLKNANQQWADKQAQIQQEQTDFAIEKIEQQKEQAQKDYLKEQSGAYVDWQKQSNKYGVEAEKLAGAGLTQTGYAESSQVSMYNTYQMRVATARDALERAKLNYDNNIKEAMLANNAALAQIYADAYIKQAELALEGFQYKNDLVLDLVGKKTELENIYYNRWQDTLQQINTENALKEDIRQYNETMKWNTEQNMLDRLHTSAENKLNRDQQAAIAKAELDYKTKKDELDRDHELALIRAKTDADKELADKEWEIKKKQIEEEKNAAIAKINAQAAADQATAKYEYDLKNKSVGTVSGGSSKNTVGRQTIGKQIGNQVNKIVKNTFTGTTYESATAYLKNKGVPSSYRAGLMTISEWSRRKNANSTSAHVKNYSSYSDYIRAYVNYGIQSYGK